MLLVLLVGERLYLLDDLIFFTIVTAWLLLFLDAVIKLVEVLDWKLMLRVMLNHFVVLDINARIYCFYNLIKILSICSLSVVLTFKVELLTGLLCSGLCSSYSFCQVLKLNSLLFYQWVIGFVFVWLISLDWFHFLFGALQIGQVIKMPWNFKFTPGIGLSSLGH